MVCECLRPEWSDKDNDSCYCDGPEWEAMIQAWVDNPGEDSPCVGCRYYDDLYYLI